MSKVTEVIVMLHGFEVLIMEDGSHTQQHCDCDAPECDGWNVWLRRQFDEPNEHGEPFDSADEWDADFQSYDAAWVYAKALSERFDAFIDEY